MAPCRRAVQYSPALLSGGQGALEYFKHGIQTFGARDLPAKPTETSALRFCMKSALPQQESFGFETI
jgi:hypothetical protein